MNLHIVREEFIVQRATDIPAWVGSTLHTPGLAQGRHPTQTAILLAEAIAGDTEGNLRNPAKHPKIRSPPEPADQQIFAQIASAMPRDRWVMLNTTVRKCAGLIYLRDEIARLTSRLTSRRLCLAGEIIIAAAIDDFEADHHRIVHGLDISLSVGYAAL